MTRASTKSDIHDAIVIENSDDKEERELHVRTLRRCSINGPFGGYKRDIPFDVAEVYLSLSNPSSDLADNWKADGIRDFKILLGSGELPYFPTEYCIGGAHQVRIDGETSPSCREDRCAAFTRLAPVRKLLQPRSFTANSKNVGAVIVVYFSKGDITWRHIVLAEKKPGRYLSAHIDSLNSSARSHDRLGDSPLIRTWKWDICSFQSTRYHI